MKLHGIAAGFIGLGLVFSLPAVSFAHEGDGKDDAAFVKLLNDSTSALQTSDPVLAKGLGDWANEEVKEMQEKKEGKEKEELESKEEKEMNERREAHLKLLNDSAAALKSTRPDLSAEIAKTADLKTKRVKKEAEEDAEEAGEKDEKY